MKTLQSKSLELNPGSFLFFFVYLQGLSKRRYHFQQLADDNEAAESTITAVESLKPADISPHLP
jgi:hypothetical protein